MLIFWFFVLLGLSGLVILPIGIWIAIEENKKREKEKKDIKDTLEKIDDHLLKP